VHGGCLAWRRLDDLSIALDACQAQPVVNKTRSQPADVRNLPAYTVAETAQYLRLPRTTLGTWVRSRGLIVPAQPSPRGLSFLNLVEAFVLSAIRKEHNVSMQRARKALGFVRRELGVQRPLITTRFQTDGVDLFVEYCGSILNASEGSGQIHLKEALEGHLQRIEWDESGQAQRLFPLVRSEGVKQPMAIVIDPRMGFGRPVLAGTGIRTEVVVERYRAGESAPELADDYGVKPELIEDAVRLELRAAA
jgi:uncharacterized protein (DUF433 family)